jgi:phospholipid-binding lipoprotein MlaA
MMRCHRNLLPVVLGSVLTLNPAWAWADGDALEQFNQTMNNFNHKYYTSSESGANQFFTDAVPAGVRRGVSNFFANLGEPVIAFSSLAEGDLGNAGIATRRFFYNLVWGYGGVYDLASAAGVKPEPRDMGEVICSYGLPDGPFLVLPFYGPATVGDLVGSTLPLVAGYVALGEMFFFYRAGNRVASFMDDQNKDPNNGSGQESGIPSGGSQEANGAADGDAAKAEAADYQKAKERYLATRKTVCQKHGTKNVAITRLDADRPAPLPASPPTSPDVVAPATADASAIPHDAASPSTSAPQ